MKRNTVLGLTLICFLLSSFVPQVYSQKGENENNITPRNTNLEDYNPPVLNPMISIDAHSGGIQVMTSDVNEALVMSMVDCTLDYVDDRGGYEEVRETRLTSSAHTVPAELVYPKERLHWNKYSIDEYNTLEFDNGENKGMSVRTSLVSDGTPGVSIIDVKMPGAYDGTIDKKYLHLNLNEFQFLRNVGADRSDEWPERALGATDLYNDNDYRFEISVGNVRADGTYDIINTQRFGIDDLLLNPGLTISR